LAIWKEINEAFEEHQDNVFNNNLRKHPSSFSEEDLPSDLIGFYMLVEYGGLTGEKMKKKIREICVPLGKKPQDRIRNSLCVWKETKGVKQYKNPWTECAHWEPKWHHEDSFTAGCRCRKAAKKWPKKFDTIEPASKGFNLEWDDWLIGHEGSFWRPEKSKYDEPVPWMGAPRLGSPF